MSAPIEILQTGCGPLCGVATTGFALFAVWILTKNISAAGKWITSSQSPKVADSVDWMAIGLYVHLVMAKKAGSFENG